MTTNILKHVAILLMMAGISSSCGKENEGSLKVGSITEIKSGETAINPKYGLSLSVGKINDLRCPLGPYGTCGGYVSVQFYLTTKKNEYDFTVYPRNAIAIEGIKYQLIDVLPHPVYGEEQTEKTVKVSVCVQSILPDIQWKLIRYQIQTEATSFVETYPQEIKPITIRFKNDLTIESQFPCNEFQGTYIAGNDGSIVIDLSLSFEELRYCGKPIDDWENTVISVFRRSEKYTIANDHLIIVDNQCKLYFEKKKN